MTSSQLSHRNVTSCGRMVLLLSQLIGQHRSDRLSSLWIVSMCLTVLLVIPRIGKTQQQTQFQETTSLSPDSHQTVFDPALIGARSVRPHNAGAKFSWGFASSVAADAAVRSLDTYSTHQALSRGYHEMILPRAIADSTPRMATYSGLCVVGNALVAHWLAKHGHRRKGDMYLAGDAAQDGFWAVRNLTLRKLKAGEIVR